MAVCEVCGCKTDDLDFVNGNINGLEKKVCSFCDRQLKAITGEKLTEAQLRWLNTAINKEVAERGKDTAVALKALLEKCGADLQPQTFNAAPTARVYKANSVGKTITTGSIDAADVDKDQLILELLGRVEKLENTLLLMQRKQIIKTIIEICVPVILGIIILIVFFSSGLYDTLASLYSSFM